MKALVISKKKLKTPLKYIKWIEEREKAKLLRKYSSPFFLEKRTRSRREEAKKKGIECYMRSGPQDKSKRMARKWARAKVTMKLTKKPKISDEKCPSGNRLKLNERQLIELETLSAYTTLESIANFFGIARRTLYTVLNRQPEALNAYRRGRSLGEAVISKQLFDKARSGDMPAINMYLKLKCGWREGKADFDASMTEPVEITTPANSARTLKSFYEAITSDDDTKENREEIVVNDEPAQFEEIKEKELTPYQKGMITSAKNQEEQDKETFEINTKEQYSNQMLKDIFGSKLEQEELEPVSGVIIDV